MLCAGIDTRLCEMRGGERARRRRNKGRVKKWAVEIVKLLLGFLKGCCPDDSSKSYDSSSSLLRVRSGGV